MKWMVALIILVGVLVRLPGLAAPPLSFRPTRQYRGAIIARTFYLDRMRGLTAQQVAAARQAVSLLGPMEPPVLEHAAAWGYRVLGREDLRVPRMLSVLSWAGGALALAWLLTQLLSTSAARLTGVAVMMLLPFGVVASQAIQPDSLMTALTVLAVAVAVRYDRSPSAAGLAVLIATSAAAIAVKPMAVFFVLPVVLALAVIRTGWVRGVMFGTLCALASMIPIAIYFKVVGRPGGDYGLFTELMGQTSYWSHWSTMLNRVVGLPLLAMGLIGTILAGKKSRALLATWWLGYVVFGVFFAYRVSTHDYYSLPIVPLVAASVAALMEAAARKYAASMVPRALVAIAVAGALIANALTVSAAGLFPPAAELNAQAERYERIGAAVGHSTRVVSLDGLYGIPLSYHGYLVAANWPLSIDLALNRLAGRMPVPAEQRFESEQAEFFVATSQAELHGQPDLLALLERQYPVIARDGTASRWQYVIYDLRSTRISTEPTRISVFALTSGTRSSRGSVALWSAASARWRLDVPAGAPFEIRPGEGVGPATLTIVPRPAGSSIDEVVDVPIFAEDSAVASATLTVRFKAVPSLPLTPPYGYVELPPEPVRLGSAPVTFQGWALDNFDLRRVWAGYQDSTGRVVPIGDARLTWMRPDVAALIPAAHDIYNDGWVFTLQPSALAHAPRPVVLRFYAENGDGLRAELGFRTIEIK